MNDLKEIVAQKLAEINMIRAHQGELGLSLWQEGNLAGVQQVLSWLNDPEFWMEPVQSVLYGKQVEIMTKYLRAPEATE